MLKTQPTDADVQAHGDRCLHWIVNRQKNKSYFCIAKRLGASSYCTQHAVPTTEHRMVPCPVDPKHTVFEKNLEKHVKACREIKGREKSAVNYFKADVNFDFGNERLRLERPVLSRVSTGDLKAIAVKLNDLFEKCYPSGLRLTSLLHSSFDRLFRAPSVPAGSGDLSGPEESQRVGKHIEQESSMIALLEMRGLYNRENVYMEFGCGKGKLSHHLFQSFASDGDQSESKHSAGYILIDRTKFKSLANVDRYIKHQETCKYFERLTMDIKDLDLSKIDLLKENDFVIISKHLCGPATDLTLNSLKKLFQSPEHSAKFRSHFKGIGIATCCHHLCDFDTYINQSFLIDQLKITPAEFQLIVAVSSWATLSKNKNQTNSNPNNSNNNNSNNNSSNENDKEYNSDLVFPSDIKEILGYSAKRIIDFGRHLFIKHELGLDSNLDIYTDQSAENLFISARQM